ncbi:MAG: hypothetical protein CMB99_14630 [Flavobacteriaceae bacterium]|nr:hypothetical protein [Flavobacteriaceae bacterium]|tara:strand:- start:220108 stop:220479 length:372 start_codon:yes stop_codon:yes gene_type:complete
MKLLKRIGFYLIGVTIGVYFVQFMWKEKDVSFDYGPDARTLKSIRTKEIKYSEAVQLMISTNQIDTAKINTLLKFSDVDFNKSKPRQKPCAEYFLTGKGNLENIDLYVSRCDSIATIEHINVK